MTAKQIAAKYVRGNHDALTDNQEIKDLERDIINYTFGKMKEEIIKAYEAGFLDSDNKGMMEYSGKIYYDEIFFTLSKYNKD